MSTQRIGPKKAFRHYINEWMRKKGLNQSRIAERLDTNQARISKALNGKQQLTEELLLGFAQAMDIEVADLFRDPNAPTQEEILAGLNYDDKETVIQLISVLREKRTKYQG